VKLHLLFFKFAIKFFPLSEDIIINTSLSKAEKYAELIPQLKALVDGEGNAVANIANIMAALKYTMNFFWVGVYWIDDNELVLGPFQGPVACTRIANGKGVCGMAWQKSQTIIVDDVDTFPGHIACSSASKSEIVVPIFREKKIIGVLDVDSAELSTFDSDDAFALKQVCDILSSVYSNNK
jgi:GAF domain-containing protein